MRKVHLFLFVGMTIYASTIHQVTPFVVAEDLCFVQCGTCRRNIVREFFLLSDFCKNYGWFFFKLDFMFFFKTLYLTLIHTL